MSARLFMLGHECKIVHVSLYGRFDLCIDDAQSDFLIRSQPVI